MKRTNGHAAATFFPERLKYGPSRKPPRLIWDPQKNAWDKQVLRMQRAGFTFGTIQAKTGLSKSQVSYRCGKKTGFSFAKFRRGETEEAQQLMNRIESALGLCKRIRQGKVARRKAVR